jgi:large subunit ribosomal protein L23
MLGAVNKIYTFEVAKSANKIEIAKACEEVFGVKVAKVNTVSMRGKFRRQGRNNGGYSKSWKKRNRNFILYGTSSLEKSMPC